MSNGLVREDKREEVKGLLADLRRTIKGSVASDMITDMTNKMVSSLTDEQDKLDVEFAFCALAGVMFLEEMRDKARAFADSPNRDPKGAMNFMRNLLISMKVKNILEAMHDSTEDNVKREAEEFANSHKEKPEGMPNPLFGGFSSSGMDGMGKLGRR